MHIPDDHIYQEAQLAPMTVAEINALTQAARALPPSGDQTHVLVPDGEDPWVISHEGQLYYCTVDRLKQKILVGRFSRLADMATAELVQIWPDGRGETPEFVEIWAPELQFLDGRWYVYFALYNARNGAERLYVLESSAADAQGGYAFKGQLLVPTDRWAIDGSVLTMPEVVRATFGAAGEELEDWLDLAPLDPIYRLTFHDGSRLDVVAGAERMRGRAW